MSCICSSDGLANLGTPTCQSLQGVTKKLIFVPIYDSTGARNSIQDSDVLNQVYLTARLNDIDASKRWYITGATTENVEDTKADSVFETLNSGAQIKVQEGVRTFTGFYVRQSAQFLGKLKSMQCTNFGVYTVDTDGNLTGSVSSDGSELYPIAVDKETFDAILIKATDSTVAKIQIKFEFARTEKDENLLIVPSENITADILGSNGLLDGYISISAITATSAVVTIKTSYGAFGAPVMVEGLTAAEIDLYNVTTSLAVATATATETAPGVYALTFVAQTAADVISATALKNGFSFNTVTFIAV